MARVNRIGQAAAENGMSEADFLAHLLNLYGTAKDVAAALGLSAAAVSFALARNGFVVRSVWVRESVPELESA